jgi:uncharacterized membrane protein YqjE
MPLEKLLDNVIRYFEARLGLVKLEVEESVGAVIAKLVQALLTGVLGLLAILFLSWGLASLLNVWIGNPYAGHFMVGGFYAVALLGVLSPGGQRMLRRKTEQAASRMFERKAKSSEFNSVETKDDE